MDSPMPSHEDECPLTHLTELQLAYENTLRDTIIVAEEENTRRVMVRNLLLEHDMDDCKGQLLLEDERNIVLQTQRDGVRDSLELAETELRYHEAELRTRNRQLANLKTELASMNDLSKDSTKLLTEKLMLTRQLAQMKPELEHLQAQAVNQQLIIAEKLALQRQLSTLEVELEAEKRASKRALQKSSHSDKVDELHAQIETLRKDIIRIKCEGEKQVADLETELTAANKSLQKAAAKKNEQVDELEIQLDTLRKEGARQKTQSEKQIAILEGDIESQRKAAEKASRSISDETIATEKDLTAQLERLRRDMGREKKSMEKQVARLETELEIEKKTSKRALQKGSFKAGENEESLLAQIEELRREASEEQRRSEKQQKTSENQIAEMENRQRMLEGKLEDLKTKLKITKTHLKNTQEELRQVQAEAIAGHTSQAPFTHATNPANVRKRNAVQMSIDANIGTPDGVAVRGKRAAVKKGRVDQSLLGEKSTFSITPFLNRTINISAETPVADSGDIDPACKGEDFVSPVPISKMSIRAMEEIVASEFSTNASKKTKHVPRKNVLKELKSASAEPKITSKAHAKKIVLERVTEEEDEENEPPLEAAEQARMHKANPRFNSANNVEEAVIKKKRRKILGNATKTLFDDDEAEVPKRPAKVTLGARKMGAKGSLLAAPMAVGFSTFSPLKKDRRGANASFLV